MLGNILRTLNLQETYADDADLWMVILAAEAFEVQSMYHKIRYKSPVQMVIWKYMILTIKHIVGWKFMHQHKQSQIEKDFIRKNSIRIDFSYKVGDKFLIINKE